MNPRLLISVVFLSAFVAMQITAADAPLKKWQPGKGWGWVLCRSSWEVCPRFQKSEFVARTALRTSRMGSLALHC